MLEPHQPVPWKPVYRSPEMLGPDWGRALEASLAGDWTPSYLGLEQLIKHALALNSHRGDRTAHLIYVYWEPVNGDEFDEVVEHRRELGTLQEMVGADSPRLHALTYKELIAEWSALSGPEWVAAHADELRRRYELEI